MSPLAGKHIVVTAGPTIEPIDPVRYISNHSTGKMGYAIAAELRRRGGRVVLVTGRTALPTPEGVERIDVLTAADMYAAFMERFAHADGAVMCAAVADYTPVECRASKIKKSDEEMTIRLRRTHDIAAEAGASKGDRIVVGFALETDNELENAAGKLRRKNLDMIVLNSLADPGAGFGGDTNKVTILTAGGAVYSYPLVSKNQAAGHIVDNIEKLFG